MASSITARAILELAIARHPAFASRPIDGSALQTMNTRQRSLLLTHGSAVEGLTNTTVDLATVFSGSLVGNDDGVPYYLDTYGDGWAQHQTDDGVPYVDFSEPAIATDPYGEHGGTPGFPLPADFIRLIPPPVAVLGDRSQRKITVVKEEQRLDALGSGLFAFVSGNRLVPMRPLVSGNSADAWADDIRSIRLSYVQLPILTSLDTPIQLPAALHEPLIAAVAEWLGAGTPALSPTDRQQLALTARRAEEDLMTFAPAIPGTTRGVVYRGRR